MNTFSISLNKKRKERTRMNSNFDWTKTSEEFLKCSPNVTIGRLIKGDSVKITTSK